MKKIIIAALLTAAATVASAQPGPGPSPSPWIANGTSTYYPGYQAQIPKGSYSSGSSTGGVSGSLLLNGASGGTTTIAVPPAAGTYNFNLPTTAGAAGQALVSAGGGSASMAWASFGTVASVAALRALGASSGNPGTIIVPDYGNGVGGGGTWVWNALSTATPNLCSVVQATGVATGRWLLQEADVGYGNISPAGCNAKGDGTTDDSAALIAAAAYSSGIGDQVVLTNGNYRIAANVTFNVDVRGVGGYITPDTSIYVAFNRRLSAPRGLLVSLANNAIAEGFFSGGFYPVRGNPIVENIYPEWFMNAMTIPGVTDGINSASDAINQAMYLDYHAMLSGSSGTTNTYQAKVSFGNGVYLIKTKNITQPFNETWTGTYSASIPNRGAGGTYVPGNQEQGTGTVIAFDPSLSPPCASGGTNGVGLYVTGGASVMQGIQFAGVGIFGNKSTIQIGQTGAVENNCFEEPGGQNNPAQGVYWTQDRIWAMSTGLTLVYGTEDIFTNVAFEANTKNYSIDTPRFPGATVTIASPAVITTGAPLAAGTPVYLTTTGALPTGLTASTAGTGPYTVYYVIAAGLTATSAEVSATPGGSAINTSGTQSGTHTLWVVQTFQGTFNNSVLYSDSSTDCPQLNNAGAVLTFNSPEVQRIYGETWFCNGGTSSQSEVYINSPDVRNYATAAIGAGNFVYWEPSAAPSGGANHILKINGGYTEANIALTLGTDGGGATASNIDISNLTCDNSLNRIPGTSGASNGCKIAFFGIQLAGIDHDRFISTGITDSAQSLVDETITNNTFLSSTVSIAATGASGVNGSIITGNRSLGGQVPLTAAATTTGAKIGYNTDDSSTTHWPTVGP